MISSGTGLLTRLREEAFDDEEILALIKANCSGYQKSDDRTIVFSFTEVIGDTQATKNLATVKLNKRGEIKEIVVGSPLHSAQHQAEFVKRAVDWRTGQNGYIVLLRPVFAHLPLKGRFKWKNKFQIRPLRHTENVGSGLDWFQVNNLSGKNDEHLGPPFPFVLEVKAQKSEDHFLGYSHGLRLLTEYESLLSVILIPHLTTFRTHHGKRWTSIWQNERITYHLLQGGYDIGENGLSEDFTTNNWNECPVSSSDDYYKHLFIHDKEIHLPPNIADLLGNFEALPKNLRRSFLRACTGSHSGSRIVMYLLCQS